MDLFYKDENGNYLPFNGMDGMTIEIPEPTADDLSTANSVSNAQLSTMTLTEIADICRQQRKKISLCLGCPILNFCDKYFGRGGATACPKYWPLDE